MALGVAHTIHACRHHFGWNPENSPVQTVAPGETVAFDVVDSAGGEITPDMKSRDLADVDHSKFAPLTGPIFVDGAVPGDAVKITFHEFAPSGWGWSGVTTLFGILPDHFPDPHLKIWHYDKSGSVPAMYNDIASVPLKPFPGIIGLSPATPGTHSALPPYPTGGNLDTRDLSVGTELFLPVEVAGGLLSVGDTHAAQGHGELAGTALESPMSLAITIDLVKDMRLPGPQFVTAGPVTRHLDSAGYYGTCGVNEDLVEAARLATLQMIDLLQRDHGLDAMDAYLLCSVCGDLCISEMVNRPVNVVTLYFPRCVFD